MFKFIFYFVFLVSSLFAQEKVVLQLKWLHQFQFAGYYAALEKGFYKEVGLDVTIKERIPAINNVEQVLSGEAQYGVSDSILLLYRAKKRPVVIVSPVFQHSPSVVLTLKNSGLDSPYKLNDKKLVFYEKDTDGFGILAMLNTINVTPNIVRVKNKTNYADLMDGKVDAYSAYITNEPFYFKEKGIELNILNPTNYGADLYGDMIFTSEDEAKANPKRVEKFRKASLKGWEYALSHKEEIIQLIKNKYAKNKSIEHLRYEADGIEQMIEAKTIPLGTLDKGRLTYTINTYSKFGLIDKNIPLDNYIFEFFQNKKMEENFTKEEIEYLAKKQELKVCVNPLSMPFEKIEDEKHIGMTFDYMRLIEKAIEIPINLVPTQSWTESLKYAQERKCDMLSLAMQTSKRKSYLNFTKPYLIEPLVLVTSIEEIFIDNIANLKNESVAIVKGYAIRDIIDARYKNLRVVEVENIDEGLELVKEGRVFGMIDSLSALAYQIQKKHIGQLKISTKLKETLDLGMGVRSDEPLLVSILDKVTEKITEEEKQKILNKWVSISYEKGVDYTLVFKWVLGITFSFILIVFFIARASIKLYKEVEARKIVEQELTRYIDLVDKYVIISTTDLDGVITDASEAFCEVSGFAKEEVIGKTHSIIRFPDTPNEFYANMWNELIKKDYWEGEIQNVRKDGEIFWMYAHISSIYNMYGNKIGYTGIRKNITDKKLLEVLSITDELTKVYNRRYFNEMSPKIINSAKRNDDYIAFAILDVDYFKLYNDTYGHTQGDKILQAIAGVLSKALNRADDFCFRLGGEEFGFIFKSDEYEKALEFTESLRQDIENLQIKHEKNTTSPYVSASFGLVIKRASMIKDVESIYKEADELLYKAKEDGRNQVKMNTPS